jgi:aspartate dehydrogenase
LSRIRIGIVGCGTIGGELAGWIHTHLKNKARLGALYDLNPSQSKRLDEFLSLNSLSVGSMEQLVAKSDLVIEAASIEAVPLVAKEVLQKGKDLFVMSVGGLLQNQGLIALAQEHGCRIYIPSGAIGGLDAVKGAALSKIATAVLTTRKAPEALADAPYWKEKQKEWQAISEETVLFEGNVTEAIRLFPKNINVSAALQLAAPDADWKVKIVAVPGLRRNMHEIRVEGESGKMVFQMENLPAPGNPKTSYLAVLSAKALLENLFSTVRLGS